MKKVLINNSATGRKNTRIGRLNRTPTQNVTPPRNTMVGSAMYTAGR